MRNDPRLYCFWYESRRDPATDKPGTWTRDSDGVYTFEVATFPTMVQARLHAAWRNFRRPGYMKRRHAELKGQRRCQ